MTWSAMARRGLPATSAARPRIRPRDSSYRADTSAGVRMPALTSSRAVPISGSAARSAATAAAPR